MSERSVKDTRPSDSYLPVVNVDYLTGLFLKTISATAFLAGEFA